MASTIIARFATGAIALSTIQCIRYTNKLALTYYPTNFNQLSTPEKYGEYFRHGYLLSCGVILGITSPLWVPPLLTLEYISKKD